MYKIALNTISKKISSGLTPLRSNPDFWDSQDIPWVKTEQLGVKHIYDSNEKVSKLVFEKTGLKLNPKNTLSIAMYGEGKTRGSVSILKKEMTTNQACCNVVIDSKKADYEYVYYFLKTQYHQLRNLSSGVRKNLNSNDIKNFEIGLPDSISEQNKIAKVLSDLDAKIELNNKINAELEGMAKLLYDYWFVQFDFPISEAYASSIGKPELKDKPYKSSGGAMVYNEQLKREIPEGWDVGTLLDIANFTNGIACQKYRPHEGEESLRVIKIREMGDGFTDKSEFVSKSIPEKVIVFNGDVLFSWSATLDVKIWTGGIGGLNQHIFKITSSNYPRTYYYFEILQYLQHFKMIAELRKTTMGHITQDHLKQSRIVIPPLNLINNLHEQIDPIINKTVVASEENQKLSELRDWLLPMLMNGQVRVGEGLSASGFSGLVDDQDLSMAAEDRGEYGQ
ncbi:hypothetical protein BFP72_05385 [Reichenbachiella sp. 5M10]|uniref:restriction endonuclease subunit S n=1 Tax=Reichenbachiella sp. 5M10 TaxID=1889772 RepID=UPI000C15D5B3|nr:restriction endonuclease subunit S [Reichenbachiella sp. 5M10]PIB34874.1 hypothetical protein BFP72_05385 [Reichenbachiella sp. 5M10]